MYFEVVFKIGSSLNVTILLMAELGNQHAEGSEHLDAYQSIFSFPRHACGTHLIPETGETVMAAGDKLLPDTEPPIVTLKVVTEAVAIGLLFFGLVFAAAFALFGPPHSRPDLSGECAIAIFSAIVLGIALLLGSRR